MQIKLSSKNLLMKKQPPDSDGLTCLTKKKMLGKSNTWKNTDNCGKDGAKKEKVEVAEAADSKPLMKMKYLKPFMKTKLTSKALKMKRQTPSRTK